MSRSIPLSMFLLASGKLFDGIERLDKVRDKLEKEFTSWALGSGWALMSGSSNNLLKTTVEGLEKERSVLKGDLEKKEETILLLKSKIESLEVDLASARDCNKKYETQLQDQLQIMESASALSEHLANVVLLLCDVVLDGMKALQNQKGKTEKLLQLASDFFVQANSVVSKDAMTDEYRIAEKALLEAIKEAGDG